MKKDLSNDNMIHIKDGNVEYLQFKKLLEYKDKVCHCYTLKGQNNNYKENDGINYKELCDSLGIEVESIKRVEHQIHSDIIGIVNKQDEIFTDMDGLITDKKNINLTLRYADCTPIIFFEPNKKVIGDIHSGWRGTVQKIGQKAAIKMIEEFDLDKEKLLCFIGPCICKCHFEVRDDVKEIFENTFSYLLDKNLFITKKEKEENEEEDKYYIDTNIINRKLLEEIGIPGENIIESNICTVCNSKLIHSHRKDKEKAGRNIMIIGLK